MAAKLRGYISTVEASFKETLKEVLCVTTPELNLSTKVGRWVGRLVGEAPAVPSWPTPTLHQHPLRPTHRGRTLQHRHPQEVDGMHPMYRVHHPCVRLIAEAFRQRYGADIGIMNYGGECTSRVAPLVC